MSVDRANMIEHQRLLYRIAVAYYEGKKTQEEIAKQYGISRSKVFLLIAEMQQRGIVEAIIDYPDSWHEQAQTRLRKYFPEINIYVLQARGNSLSTSYDKVCSAAADYLNGIISNKAVLSVSRGKTMWRMSQFLNPYQTYPGMLVLQLSGLMEQKEPFYEEIDLVRRIAEAYSCRYRCFALPYIVSTKELHDQLVQCAIPKEYHALMEHVSILYSSVSTLEPWQYGLEQKDYQDLLATDAVGSFEDIFLDLQGNVIQTPLSGRLVAPTEASIRGIPNRVCVASGGYKARALLAVLRSGLPTTVFIDSNLAIRILNLIETDRYEI